MSAKFARDPSSTAKAVRARTSTKPKILIAEDSPDGREMMTMLLSLKGYDVVAAENGMEAVKVALEKRPDLILMDLELPKLNGIDVARNLRRHNQLKNTPIIIVSGHDPVLHRQIALEAGCTDYLLKPIDFDRLDTILTTQLSPPGSKISRTRWKRNGTNRVRFAPGSA
jgi:two-component system, cell cycle response regulator DivK